MYKTQNYKNHLQLYPLHHFILLPLTLGLFIWSITQFFSISNNNTLIFNILSSLSLILILFITRIYALKNQDRIIRLEMRQRYLEITGKPFKTIEKQLRLSQIVALRFAGDQEFLSLIDSAIAEKLTGKQIKLAIQDWQGDYRRI